MLRIILQISVVLLFVAVLVLMVSNIILTYGWGKSIPYFLIVGVSVFITLGSLKRKLYQVREGVIAIIERGGAFHGIAEPGPILLGPFDSVRIEIPMHEIIFECEPQHVLTKDAVPLEVEMVLSYQVMRDSEAIKRAVYNVYDWREATEKEAIAALHTVIGGFSLLDENSSIGDMQSYVSNGVQEMLGKEAKRWGVNINRVYLRNIRVSEMVAEHLYGKIAANRYGVKPKESESFRDRGLSQISPDSKESAEVARRFRAMLETMT